MAGCFQENAYARSSKGEDLLRMVIEQCRSGALSSVGRLLAPMTRPLVASTRLSRTFSRFSNAERNRWSGSRRDHHRNN
jgi:hypothetical protein